MLSSRRLTFFPRVAFAAAAKQGVIGTPNPARPIWRPSVVNFSFDQAANLTEERSPAAATSALVLAANMCQTAE